MDKFIVHLRSRGDHLKHGLIRTHYDIRAHDDVDAAMLAKEEAKKQFPDRSSASWFTDKVERKGKRA
jgi:hypothetical protein